MKCSQCGETITGNDKFCGNCGAPVPPQAPEPVQDLVEEVEPMAEQPNEFPEPVEFESEDVSVDEDPTFEDVAEPFAPPDFGGEPGDVTPPPPPPVEKKKPSTGLIIGIVVAVLLLCCCCSVIGIWLLSQSSGPISDIFDEIIYNLSTVL
jgi:hypothetical protein